MACQAGLRAAVPRCNQQGEQVTDSESQDSNSLSFQAVNGTEKKQFDFLIIMCYINEMKNGKNLLRLIIGRRNKIERKEHR